MIAGTMRSDLYPELLAVEDNHWWHRQKRQTIHRLIKRFKPRPGRILDVGCGAGKLLEELKKSGWQADGVDMVLAQSRQRGLSIKKADLQSERLPFAANHFDLIVCLDTLEHMKDDKRLVNEMIRVAKKGGIIIISVPAYQWLFSYWDKMLGHFRRYNSNSLIKVLPKKSIRVQFNSYYFSYLLLPAIAVRAFKAITGQKQKSDFAANPLPPVTGSIIRCWGRLESIWLKHASIPFGLSLVCVVKKI